MCNTTGNNLPYRKKYVLKLLSFIGILTLMLALALPENALAASSGTLNTKQVSVIAISAYTANGDMEKLKPALAEGIEAGLTVNEVKEILVQLYAYCGFPRSLNGIHMLMALLEERRQHGINDTIGKEATPMPAGMNRDQYGAETRAKIGGRATIPPPSGYQVFAPVIDSFLKEHLFADIFYRDVLDWQTRELATISALAAMSGTAGQLQFHLGGAMNMGMTEEQLREFITVIAEKVGKQESEVAGEVLVAVLAARNK
jgi:alkylhydroperoxidase/carboxymuconolactone decarboxylase family protein YurZ